MAHRTDDRLHALYAARERYRERLEDPDPRVEREARQALREINGDLRRWYAEANRSQ